MFPQYDDENNCSSRGMSEIGVVNTYLQTTRRKDVSVMYCVSRLLIYSVDSPGRFCFRSEKNTELRVRRSPKIEYTLVLRTFGNNVSLHTTPRYIRPTVSSTRRN